MTLAFLEESFSDPNDGISTGEIVLSLEGVLDFPVRTRWDVAKEKYDLTLTRFYNWCLDHYAHPRTAKVFQHLPKRLNDICIDPFGSVLYVAGSMIQKVSHVLPHARREQCEHFGNYLATMGAMHVENMLDYEEKFGRILEGHGFNGDRRITKCLRSALQTLSVTRVLSIVSQQLEMKEEFEQFHNDHYHVRKSLGDPLYACGIGGLFREGLKRSWYGTD